MLGVGGGGKLGGGGGGIELGGGGGGGIASRGAGGGGGGLSAEGAVGVTWGESMSIRDTVRSRGGGGCWATRGDDWTGDMGVLLGPAAGAWRWRGESGLDARALWDGLEARALRVGL